MSTVNELKGGDTALTLDISSLATSSTFLAGYESVEVAAGNNLDFKVFVKPITGHASTAPTIGQSINIWVWGSKESLATTPIDTLDGTASAETLSHSAILNSFPLAGISVVTAATAGLTYYIPPFNIAPLFGGTCPDYWGLFVAHNHTGALAASQSALFSYKTINKTVA